MQFSHIHGIKAVALLTKTSSRFKSLQRAFIRVINTGPEVIIFMLNSTEHEIFPAHKC